MLYACWSLKGGTGTTSIATALALNLARENKTEILLVDLAGDASAVLGIASSTPVGVGDWLSAKEDADPTSLKHLEYEIISGLHLLPRGRAPLATLSEVLPPDALVAEMSFQTSLYAEKFIKHLANDKRMVIIDCGNIWDEALHIRTQGESQRPDILYRRAVVKAADVSWCFTRSCYLSLRRMAGFHIRANGIVFVREQGRALSARDIEDITGSPIIFGVSVEPAVMTAVDSGLLSHRLPRRLEKMLADLFPPDSKTNGKSHERGTSKNEKREIEGEPIKSGD